MESRTVRLLLMLAASTAAMLVFVAAFWFALVVEACENNVGERVLSPDGKRVAVVYQRGCGATTGFSTQISIIGSRDTPRSGGNTFIADDRNGVSPRGSWGGPMVRVWWTSSDELTVAHHPGIRVFDQRDRVRRVSVHYTELDPANSLGALP